MTPRRGLMGLALLAVVAGMVVAYHPQGGPVLGTVPLDQGPSMPVVDGRTARAFVGDGGRVHVLDTVTGALLRTVTVAPSAAGVRAELLAVDEQVSRVVVLGEPPFGSLPLRGYVSVLDAHSGQLVHTTPVTVGGANWLAVDAQAGRAVIVGIPNYPRPGVMPGPVDDVVRVSMVDVVSGHLVRAVRLPLPRQFLSGWIASGSPVAIDGRTDRIFASRFDGTSVSVLDTATGRVMRTVRPRAHRYGRQTTLTAFALAVDERTNRVFVGDSLGGAMSVLDATSGRLLRTTRLPVSANPSAPLADTRTGRVFVVDGAGVAMFDIASGRLLHTVVVPSRPGMSPALDLAVDEHSGRVFAVDPQDGVVRVLDGWSGLVLRAVHLGTALVDLAVDSRRGRLIVTIPGDEDRAAASTAPGRVVVLDERTGALLRTIMLAPAPLSLAMDAGTGHVVVVTSGGQAPAPDRWSWLPPGLRRRLPFLPPRPSTLRTVPPSVSVLDVT